MSRAEEIARLCTEISTADDFLVLQTTWLAIINRGGYSEREEAALCDAFFEGCDRLTSER